MDNCQVYHQAMIIETEGMLYDQFFLFLINPSSNISYINTTIIEKCAVNKEAHSETWLVQLDTGKKRRIEHWVKTFPIKVNEMPMTTNLNVIPLGA